MNNLPKVLKTGLNVLFYVCLAATIIGSAGNILNHYGIIALRCHFGGIFAIVVSVYTVGYFIFTLFPAGSKKGLEADRVFRFQSFLNIASLGTVIIAILACVTAVLIIPYESDGIADIQTITNFYTAFIALCTTFVVGFQIYNAIDFNKRINRITEEREVLEKRIEELNKATITSSYFNAYTVGTIRYNEAQLNAKDSDITKRYCWNAIRAYFNALRYAAQGGHDFNDAMQSFGVKKIGKCISELISIHEEYPKTLIEKGNDDSIMPSLSDRQIYIYDTYGYITSTLKIMETDDAIGIAFRGQYIQIVEKWMSFIEKYYNPIYVTLLKTNCDNYK